MRRGGVGGGWLTSAARGSPSAQCASASPRGGASWESRATCACRRSVRPGWRPRSIGGRRRSSWVVARCRCSCASCACASPARRSAWRFGVARAAGRSGRRTWRRSAGSAASLPCCVRYDNLSAAVRLVLRVHRREETDRFVALGSHYLFESTFTLAGLEGAHDKGGVEGSSVRVGSKALVCRPAEPLLVPVVLAGRRARDRDPRRRPRGRAA